MYMIMVKVNDSDSKMLKISLLIPIYGVERYIEKCVHSLFSQTAKNVEYIFVDDCSPDSSITLLYRVLDEYPHRRNQVSVIRHPQNMGLAAARNTALEHATGKYVLHVDSDDYLEQNAVEVLALKAEQEDADIVVFDFIQVFQTKSVRTTEQIQPDRVAYIRHLFRRQASVTVCGKMIRRSLYVASGVRAVAGLNFGEDYVTTPRLVYSAKKIVKLNLPLYYYVRFNTNSYTRTFSDVSIQNICRAVEILETFFSNVPDAELYTAAIRDLKVYNETALLKCGSIAQRKHIVRMFNGIPSEWYCTLSVVDRLVVVLAHKRMWFILDLYIRIGFFLKQLFR